ncbi:MAG: restriction endonuclease subunit S, partial [Neisseriaceae bacterium]|nr:restriction endonuclease subunit S [Neisseriaceae bacterium]
IIRCNGNKYNPYFIYSFLRSNLFRNQTKKNGSGSAQPQLPIHAINNIAFPDICLPTQQKIAAILSSLDDKIETNNKIASVLEKMMKEIYNYWFVQFDFPDKNGKPYQASGGEMVYNPTLKREIPKGWAVKKLEDIFTITMGSSPKGHSLNENGNGIEFYQGSTDFGRLYPTIRVFTTEPVRFAKSQDILMSVRAPVGAMNIAMNDCCIGRGLAAIHHESPLFAWYTMLTFKSYFDTFNWNGTTFGSLTSDTLKEQLTVAPDKSILQMFIKKTQSVGEKLKTITMENIQLTALRDFLLPLLMNGQASVQ